MNVKEPSAKLFARGYQLDDSPIRRLTSGETRHRVHLDNSQEHFGKSVYAPCQPANLYRWLSIYQRARASRVYISGTLLIIIGIKSANS